MTKIYILEVFMLAIIIDIFGIILRRAKKNDEKKYSKKRRLDYPLIILFTGVTIILLQYIFEKPQLNFKEKIEVQSGDSLEEAIPIYYHNRNIINECEIEGNTDFKDLKTHHLRIIYKNLINKSVDVQVIDTKPPEIKTLNENNSNIKYNYDFEHEGFEAKDNYDGDVKDKVTVTREELDNNKIKITYSCIDSNNNETNVERKYNLVDTVPPILTLKGQYEEKIKQGTEYVELGARAIDEKDGDLSDRIEINSSKVNTNEIGTYNVNYVVTDNSNNPAIAIRKVKVVSPEEFDNYNGVVFLTFDDGPSTKGTPQVLDILKSRGVKASFFLINYNEEGKEIIRREIDEGHTICLHSYTHNYGQIYSSEEAYFEDLNLLRNKVKNDFGIECNIIRFPGGSSNTISSFNPGIMSRLTQLVTEQGYHYFDWNDSGEDAGNTHSADEVYDNMIANLSEERINVVLCHDNGNSKLLDALPRFIDICLENGYTFSTLDMDTPQVHHPVNN